LNIQDTAAIAGAIASQELTALGWDDAIDIAMLPCPSPLADPDDIFSLLDESVMTLGPSTVVDQIPRPTRATTDTDKTPPAAGPGALECGKCQKRFTRIDNRRRHNNTCKGFKRVHACKLCKNIFAHAFSKLRHERVCKGIQPTTPKSVFTGTCETCGKTFSRNFCLKRHQAKCFK